MKDFGEWMKERKDDKLYHEYLFDEMFKAGDVTEAQKRKIMYLIHESLLQGFSASAWTKINYNRLLTERVKVHGGPYEGQTYHSLPLTDEVWQMCLQIKKATNDPIIRQACISKLNAIQTNREMLKEKRVTKTRGSLL